MSYVREPFADYVGVSSMYIIPEHIQVIVTEMFEVDVGGVLIIKPTGKLVVEL